MQAQTQKPLLLRDFSMSKTQIAFSYAGSIWISSHDGGNVRCLTNGGHEGKPVFLLEGLQIAFTGSTDWLGAELKLSTMVDDSPRSGAAS